MNFQDYPATTVQPPPVRSESSRPVITYLSVAVLPEIRDYWTAEHGQDSLGPLEGLELDIQRRQSFGVAKYGELLTTKNGRDPLVDAFQEVLDLIFYLAQAIMEAIPGPRADFLDNLLRSTVVDALSIRTMIEEPNTEPGTQPEMATEVPVQEIKRIK